MFSRRGRAGLLAALCLTAVAARPTDSWAQSLTRPTDSWASAITSSFTSWTSAWTRKNEELWRRQEELWRRLDRGARPPAGAIYVGTMNMPVIGRQTFMLKVLGRQRCQITLIGMCASHPRIIFLVRDAPPCADTFVALRARAGLCSTSKPRTSRSRARRPAW